MAKAIQVENLSKQYRLGQIGTGSLAHDVNRWWHSVRGKEDPYLKIGEANDRSTKGASEYVWSLRDINFEIEQGDSVGIIGRNGAGKSTLLKILSRVTAPTTGHVKVKGRIASLLEVGTGFHPDLSGRDNIYLNGAILGMRKQEISRHFDAIVDFAGVERYIDTPVKRYSSGMYVRLAFAVAAHLESEILIVDEVLAVGDAEFQKKCLGKMNEVSKSEGRTILFVSHNMTAVQNLCESGIVLKDGQVNFIGSIEESTKTYLQIQNRNKFVDLSQVPSNGNQRVIIEDIKMYNSFENVTNGFSPDEKIILRFKIKNVVNSKLIALGHLDIGFNNSKDERVAWVSTSIFSDKIDFTSQYISLCIEELNLIPGEYNLNFLLSIDNDVSDWKQNVCYFTITENDFYNTGKTIKIDQGYILPKFNVI